jgi:sulfur transfer protein SufE
MSLEANESRLLEALAVLPGHHERLAYVIEKFGGRGCLSEAEKLDVALVPGCTARLWLVADAPEDGTLGFRTESDSPMVDGLAGLLAAVVEGCAPTELAAVGEGMPRIIAESGMGRALSPTRQRGMGILWAVMRAEAARR